MGVHDVCFIYEINKFSFMYFKKINKKRSQDFLKSNFIVKKSS